MSTPALKEWAVVVRALVAGEQLLDLRKGGLHEDGRHFTVESTRVWLYPTVEHQRVELLKPAYRRWVDDPDTTAPSADTITIPGWADIVGVAELTEPDDLAKLDGKFVWTLDYAASRLKWKRRDPLWVLAMRVHRLTEPISIPHRPEYDGCTSWVQLHGLPEDPADVASEPALSDESFTSRVKLATNDIPGQFEQPHRAG